MNVDWGGGGRELLRALILGGKTEGKSPLGRSGVDGKKVLQ
jgi:hypothetical protein